MTPFLTPTKLLPYLKYDEKCDYVIYLSHLGHKYGSNKVSDLVLVGQSKGIDLIIGRHTHAFLEKLVSVKNRNGEEVQITQVGWAGIWLGKIEIYFAPDRKKFLENNSQEEV